jgi:hypothetical protein
MTVKVLQEEDQQGFEPQLAIESPGRKKVPRSGTFLFRTI